MKGLRGWAAAALLAPLAAAAVEVDGIAAKVDSEVILRSDVMAEMRRAGIADESRYGEVRNQMIERKLILKAARAAKMTIQDWMLENRIREVIDNGFGGDRNKLLEALAEDRIPYTEWRDQIREDLIVSAMRWNTIDKSVNPSPAQMKAEYEAHPERYTTDRRVTVSVILLKPEDAGKRAEIGKALKTTDFAELAKRYSADPHAKDGGLWKDVKPEEAFKPEVCEEIAKMPRGTVSHWIEIDGWSFLLRKDEDAAAAPIPFADAYERIERNVRRARCKELHAAWIERLKAESYIKVY